MYKIINRNSKELMKECIKNNYYEDPVFDIENIEDIQGIKSLLNEGAPISKENIRDCIINDNIAALKTLVEYTPTIFSKSMDDTMGNLSILKNRRNKRNNRLFFEVFNNNFLEFIFAREAVNCAYYILNKFPENIDLYEYRSIDRRDFLRIACKHGHVKLVAFLSMYYPSFHNDNYFLEIACDYGHVELVKYILSILTTNNVGDSLLSCLMESHREIIPLLLNHGANIESLIEYAISYRNIEALKMALSYDSCDRILDYALKYACMWGDSNAVREILQRGADKDTIPYLMYIFLSKEKKELLKSDMYSIV